ncbi:hypothetical protein BX667DRAFT_474790 [Coemansia mojavensis]|nr:hypothetical protein BX667DRAFT_474790 [Coemansia mojavensis]
MDVCGLNTLVRWGSYNGYNIEDGIVITKTLAQKTLIIKKSFSLKLEKEELLVPLISGDKYDKRGIVRLGTLVKNGDTLATKIKISKDGLITKSYLTALVDKESKVVEVVVRDDIVIVVAEYESNLRLGDKMVSSHSQKGVVAHVADIPSVDLVINPCSIPSRMTLGQIWEGIISNKIVEENLTTPVYFPAFTNERSLFLKYDTIDENISKDFGYWQCYNRYFVLGQRVEEKFRVRGDSTKTNINNFTNQPQKGRKRGGGLRFGVMERDVMLAHGATKTLETLTSDQSDLRECYYCNQCSSYSGDSTCSTCSSTLTKISVSQSKINKDNIMKFIY